MVSYEYGTKFFRPHMHVIFFGYNPTNQQFLKKTSSGYPLTTSDEIAKLWTNKNGESMGFHSIGTANEKTAYYIASYALKGKTKTIYHPTTGESVEISDSMDVSKRPAIGRNYFIKNTDQLTNLDSPLPRYYAKSLEEYSTCYYMTDKEIEKLSEKELRRRDRVLNDFKNVNPDLFEQYQNKIYSKITNRPDQELYAKFIIDSQKNSVTSTTYRDSLTEEEERRQKFNSRYLKTNRDNYVSSTKGKIK